MQPLRLSFAEHHPEWKLELWDETRILNMLAGFPDACLLKALQRAPSIVEKVRFTRRECALVDHDSYHWTIEHIFPMSVHKC